MPTLRLPALREFAISLATDGALAKVSSITGIFCTVGTGTFAAFVPLAQDFPSGGNFFHSLAATFKNILPWRVYFLS
ncbi:MAG: hypothetical protein WCL08_10040 [Verrucomicrobiota bacterium]